MVSPADASIQPFPSPSLRLAIPLALFAVLASLTTLVWLQRKEVLERRLHMHTSDVCSQTARYLELLGQSQIQRGEFFAERWITHEGRDFSEQRFTRFATVLLRQSPALRAVSIVNSSSEESWLVSLEAQPTAAGAERLERVLATAQAAVRAGKTQVSAPLAQPRLSVFAAIPMSLDDTPAGTIVLEIDPGRLVDQAIEVSMRAQFNFKVISSDTVLASLAPDANVDLHAHPFVVTREITLAESRWEFYTLPQHHLLQATTLKENPSVALLGFPLSVALSALTWLLLRRVALYQEARDQTLAEMARREIIQQALHDSETRYRSLFESSTDGLLILTPQGEVLEANPAAMTLGGGLSGKITGQPFTHFLVPEFQSQARECLHQLLQFGTTRGSGVALRQDGTRVEVEMRGARFAHGGQTRLLVIITDVSERRRSETRLALLSRKVLLAQEEERARLSRELHDELGQVLTALHLELGWVKKQVITPESNLAELISRPVELVQSSAAMLRRICRGLRPPALDDLGLEAAVQTLLDEFQERSSVALNAFVDLQSHGAEIPMEIALCTYRILQESLTNVTRHSRASTVEAQLTLRLTELRLSVYDDGRGFDMAEMEDFQGSGLAGMAERAHLVGGTLEIHSAKFQGTRVTFLVTLPSVEVGSDDTHPGSG